MELTLFLFMRVFHFHFLVFSIIFFSSCVLQEYDTHWQKTHSNASIDSLITRIAPRTGVVDVIYVLPNPWFRSDLVSKIDWAERRVYLQIYILTDQSILNALINANKRGIDVRVVIEWNPYKMPWVNNKTLQELRKNNIPFRFSDVDRFSLNHAKFMIVDDHYYISTGNFTRSFFESNRDVVIEGSDMSLIDALEQLFLADYSHETFALEYIGSWMILSPENSFSGILSILESAHSGVDLMVQSITDPRIIESAWKQIDRGIDVFFCVGNVWDELELYEKYNIQYFHMKKPYLHAKIIIIDNRYVFIGSQNLTRNSLENNREVGLYFEPSQEQIKQIKYTFERDCKKGK